MYGKIFKQIFSSSIMKYEVDLRYIWMSLIALADKEGYIDMTEEAIARQIDIDVETVKRALDEFQKPDIESRSKEEEGRRLVKIREGFGWKIVNKIKYTVVRNENDRRNYMREYMRSYRAKEKPAPNKPKIDYEMYANKWNDFAVQKGLQPIKAIDEKRKAKINARLNEKLFDFDGILKAISEQPFLLGDKGWKVTFDFIITNPNNYMKILEKGYTQKEGVKDESSDAIEAVNQWANKRKYLD